MAENSSDNKDMVQGQFLGQTPSPKTEEESRKMILESYEKAGVDLPLVSLETVLDREISADDARKSGTPRFRKFLNKASAAINNRDNSSIDSRSSSRNDEIVNEALSDASFSPRSSPNGSSHEDEIGPFGEEDDPDQPPRITIPEKKETAPEPDVKVDAPAPESNPTDTACHPNFDFCCPKTITTNQNPNDSVASENKYIMSNMQLPEGFDDEYYHNKNLQEARGSPALMDVEDSLYQSSVIENDLPPSYVSKEKHNGLMTYLRKSGRFRWAMIVCCLLHVVFVGMIIAFVKTEDKLNYEAGLQTSASLESQDETTTTGDISTFETLFPEPDTVMGLPGTESLEVKPVEKDFNDASSTIEPPKSNEELEISEETTEVEFDPAPPTTVVEQTSEPSPAPTPCVDSLELSLNCFGVGSEVLVFFESCVPQAGDWVAIYDAREDSQNLLDSDATGWLYTCGDRFCAEPVLKEVLSFTRAIDRAGPGMYRAHLLRETEGPLYSAIATSKEFTVVADDGASCPSK
mmetsp:Transcript_16129/g.44670  ORF Transcript_16129/g.44670 Transcript_16129/m.44670 type:complete len:520 (-) Transcript_16129:268-1827(-)